MNNEEALAEGDLLEIVDAAWADALGCPTSLLHDPGAHLVPGGAGLAGYRGLYMARLGRSVLVYAPPTHVGAARRALSAAAPEEIFSAESCLAIAGAEGRVVLGPSWHGFVDLAHFHACDSAVGERVERDDPTLEEFHHACGKDEWSEVGFAHAEGLIYALRQPIPILERR